MEEPKESRPSVLDAACEGYRRRFGLEPAWAAVAPGRVNLIGEHTDYNNGFVLPMAIERHTAIVAGPSDEGEPISLTSLNLGETSTLPRSGPIERGEPSWANYARGVVAGFLRLGVDIPAFRAAMASDVPLGGGLSSSAAFEVATATLLEAITGHRLTPVDKALLCQ